MILQNLNLKFLLKAHTKLGLFALYFFYISAFFGTIALFVPQIKTWENLSRYFIEQPNYSYTLNALIKRTIQEEGFNTKLIEVTLPSYKDNVIAINDPSSRTKYINPYTLKMLDTSQDKAFLSQFFNEIHMGRNIPNIGQFLMGISSVLMLFLTLSGLILFFNKHKKNKSDFNFKWHKNISMILLPYILVFSLTGAVIGFMFPTSWTFALSATHAEQSNMRALVGPIIFSKDVIPSKSNVSQNMINIDTLMKKAKELYPALHINKFKLLQWNDKNAHIKFIGYDKNQRALSGRVNRLFITLDAHSAKEIERKDLQNAHTIATTLSGFYFFHFIPDETLLVRVLYFIVSLIFLFSLALGFLIYSNKQISKYKNKRHYYSFLNRFSIAVMLGVIPSTALTLLLYWAMPFELFERIQWIKGSFYICWAFMLLLSAAIDDILDLLKSLALITSIFLFSTILAHIIKAKKQLALLVQESTMHTVLYIDAVLLILSLLSFCFYKYAHRSAFFRQYSRRAHVY